MRTLFLYEVVLIKRGSGRGGSTSNKGRKRKSSSVTEEIKSGVSVSTKKKSKTVARRRGVDISDLTEKYFDHLYTYLGLEMLNIDRSLARKIIEDILDLLYRDASSKPALDAVMKKIDRFRQDVYGYIAYKLASELKEINSSTLEFIVYNGGKYIVSEISNLYNIAIRIGRSDLIPHLASIWDKFGNTMPIKCPRCGFRSITPDQSCEICGYVVTEDYIRKELGFDEKLREFLNYASDKDLYDIKNLGVVLVSNNSVINPRNIGSYRFTGSKVFYQINLRKNDYLLIDEEINRRKASI